MVPNTLTPSGGRNCTDSRMIVVDNKSYSIIQYSASILWTLVVIFGSLMLHADACFITLFIRDGV